ncbi:hypothetical protein [Citrobacter amalonaticus]|uniref:hypothetical protein n=1 Tax=Citrobacter amalonaticus TaxID=35703 RepID=UPI00300D8AD7
MKKSLCLIFSIFMGGVFTLALLVILRYNHELYSKFNIVRNAITISHHNYGRIHLSAYIYINNELPLSNSSCIKDVFAIIYPGNIYILKPLYGRIYIPKELGSIGKINTCNNIDTNQWAVIHWGDDGVYIGEKNNIVFVKLNSIGSPD